MTSGNRFAAVLCLAIIIDAGCSTNGGIKPIRTMVARAEDGASASIDTDTSAVCECS